jgi:hypothetical protein
LKVYKKRATESVAGGISKGKSISEAGEVKRNKTDAKTPPDFGGVFYILLLSFSYSD